MNDRTSARATLAKHRTDVAAMFDRLAPRYDVINALASLGLTSLWRQAALESLAPQPGEIVLDLAAGTGSSTGPIADAGALVIATDMSLGMLTQGRRRHPGLSFVAGDALALPFADDCFDAVTISFGLRNVHDTRAALVEMLRVTRPGGRLVICEFSVPVWGPWRRIYQTYLPAVVPAVAGQVSPNPAAYDYLVESITAWPDQQHLAAILADSGWEQIAHRNLTGGIVALHRAQKAAG